ncbi:MAG TPA: tetratricopeptide repeat protein [Cyclobacteriaceae bacterium]|nr:tetratricopeptide repeat protein [Cyclobacteriaceae bacterium]
MKYASFIVLLLFAACSKKAELVTDNAPSPQATSFAGKPLFSTPPTAAALAKSDSVINAIKAKGDLTEDDYVEIGKQLVATARYKEAVDNYTEGLAKSPNSYKLLRNRGHRYITLRQLDKCIADLTKAEELIRNEPDVMEYGLDGKPTATVRHQIWYHIGVYNYLMGDYNKAAAAFEQAVMTGGDLKNVVGASDWLYNCYQRLGDKAKAEAVIKTISPEADTDKESAYFRRIMLYKGIIKPEELVRVTMAPDSMGVNEVTKMYGLANWYSYNGDPATANTLYKTILQSNAWPGFAYAGAEKDAK